MSQRELTVLGSAAQVPTRERNHNGYVLRFDDEVILFDPGEGTQRQMTFAGPSVAKLTRVCITHFHGDHCLGLPGIVQRRSMDRADRPLDVYFPAEGAEYFDRLRHAAAFVERAEIRGHPTVPGPVVESGALTLSAVALDHRVPTLGWRLSEADGVRLVADRLDAAGLDGPEIGRLRETGSVTTASGAVTLDEVSEPRRGQTFAFVMDTVLCDAAFELARDADLLVCEATYLTCDEDLAREYKHLTAAQAARIAVESGARRLVLSHFSQRYGDPQEFAREAGAIFGDVVVAEDLATVALPPRR